MGRGYRRRRYREPEPRPTVRGLVSWFITNLIFIGIVMLMLVGFMSWGWNRAFNMELPPGVGTTRPGTSR